MNIKLDVAVLFLVVAAFALGKQTRKAKDTEAPLDSLLADISSAIHSADVKKMEQLFLPTDSTVEGQNRAANLAEIRKDWAPLNEGPEVEFKAEQAVIRLEMVDHDPAGPASGRVSDLELTTVLTRDGWRIETMK